MRRRGGGGGRGRGRGGGVESGEAEGGAASVSVGPLGGEHEGCPRGDGCGRCLSGGGHGCDCQTSPEKQPPVAGELTLQVAEKIAYTHKHKWRHSDLVL